MGMAVSSLLLGAEEIVSQVAKPSAYDVEAAYLFNFGKFVRWPQKTAFNDTFVICVLGQDPFGPILDKTISGETIDGKAVVDKRISTPMDATGCSILYISTSEAKALNRILAVTKASPALTVSDIPDFVDRGGMIQFVVRDGRVRFQVNLQATEQDGLALSSELLKVAIRVKDAGGEESHP